MVQRMSIAVSTITSKWQVTIPEEVRKDLPFKVGQRIAWEVNGDTIVGRRVPPIAELAGCLRSGTKARGGSDSAFGRAAIARHERISKQKP